MTVDRIMFASKTTVGCRDLDGAACAGAAKIGVLLAALLLAFQTACFSPGNSSPAASLSGPWAFPVNRALAYCDEDSPGCSSVAIWLSREWCDGGREPIIDGGVAPAEFVGIGLTNSMGGDIGPGEFSLGPNAGVVLSAAIFWSQPARAGTVSLDRWIPDAGPGRLPIAEGSFDVWFDIYDGGQTELTGTFRTGDALSCGS